jgi:hypothetical protein
MVVKGAGIGALPVAVSEIFTIVIFLLSFKYGFREITRTDKAFLAAALLALVPWALTHDPTISVIIAVAIDLLSLMPTFRKAWKYSSTETPALYASNVARHILILLSLSAYNLATTFHSIAMILANSGMLQVLFRKRFNKV